MLRNRLFFIFILTFNSYFAQSVLVADAGRDTIICQGQTVVLGGSPAGVGGSENYFYAWEPKALIVNDTISNPETLPLVSPTFFYLTLGDGTETFVKDSVFIDVTNQPSCNELIIYNTFTPNGDEVNDAWSIKNIEKYPSNRLQIYNRFGKIVFEAAPYGNNWGGKGLGSELPVATYYYVLELGQGMEIKKGSISIIR